MITPNDQKKKRWLNSNAHSSDMMRWRISGIDTRKLVSSVLSILIITEGEIGPSADPSSLAASSGVIPYKPHQLWPFQPWVIHKTAPHKTER